MILELFGIEGLMETHVIMGIEWQLRSKQLFLQRNILGGFKQGIFLGMRYFEHIRWLLELPTL